MWNGEVDDGPMNIEAAVVAAFEDCVISIFSSRHIWHRRSGKTEIVVAGNTREGCFVGEWMGTECANVDRVDWELGWFWR